MLTERGCGLTWEERLSTLRSDTTQLCGVHWGLGDAVRRGHLMGRVAIAAALCLPSVAACGSQRPADAPVTPAATSASAARSAPSAPTGSSASATHSPGRAATTTHHAPAPSSAYVPITLPASTTLEGLRRLPAGAGGAVEAFASALRLFAATPPNDRRAVAYRLYGRAGPVPTGPDAPPVGLDLAVAVDPGWRHFDATGGRYRVLSESDDAYMVEVEMRPVVDRVEGGRLWIGGVVAHRPGTGWVLGSVQRRANPDTSSAAGELVEAAS